MAERERVEREGDRRDARPVLLIGAGPRAREIGAVLAALSTLGPENERRGPPLQELGVADLEELLAQRPGAPNLTEGMLILESGRVPGEDIGFVRRFLERHAGWRLVVIGEDARVRGLLALTRAQWLAWPPDLEQLRALLAGSLAAPASAPATPLAAPIAPPPAPAREERRAPRRASSANGAGVDVGDLIEDLLAAAALSGDGGPRYQFQASEAFLLQRERANLAEGLGGLVELARRCAGSDGLVRAALDSGPNGLRLGLDFPRAGLPEKDLVQLLDRPFPAGGDAELAQGVTAAQHAAAVLREGGDQVELVAEDPGRVRCEVKLMTGTPPLKKARAGKPEDPFA